MINWPQRLHQPRSMPYAVAQNKIALNILIVWVVLWCAWTIHFQSHQSESKGFSAKHTHPSGHHNDTNGGPNSRGCPNGFVLHQALSQKWWNLKMGGLFWPLFYDEICWTYDQIYDLNPDSSILVQTNDLHVPRLYLVQTKKASSWLSSLELLPCKHKKCSNRKDLYVSIFFNSADFKQRKIPLCDSNKTFSINHALDFRGNWWELNVPEAKPGGYTPEK